jgi:hypothetical protein
MLHTEYERGRAAKLAGQPYDSVRTLEWRAGWLETNPEQNEASGVPANWEHQVKIYRRVVFASTHSHGPAHETHEDQLFRLLKAALCQAQQKVEEEPNSDFLRGQEAGIKFAFDLAKVLLKP